MSNPLPAALHLQTLQPFQLNGQTGSVLLRLAHQFEVNESPTNSVPFNVDLQQLFNPALLSVTGVTEMSLSANQPLSAVNRLQWQTDSATVEDLTPLGSNTPANITITPMQIRTFLLNVAPN